MDSSFNDLKLTVRITLNDFKNLNNYINKRMIYSSSIIYFFIFFIGVILFDINSNDRNLLGSAGIGAVIGLLVSVLMVFFMQQLLNKRSHKMFKSDTVLRYDQHYTFGADGISLEYDAGKGRFGWNDIYKVGGDRNALYIFISRSQAMLIPWRTLGTEEKLLKLKSLIQNNVDKCRIYLK